MGDIYSQIGGAYTHAFTYVWDIPTLEAVPMTQPSVTTGDITIPALVEQGAAGLDPWLVSAEPAADVTASGAIAALNGAVTIAVEGRSSVVFQVSGIWNGSLVVQGSADGGATWAEAAGLQIFQYPVTDLLSSIENNGVYAVSDAVAGLSHVRVIATGWTSGSASVALRGSTASNGLTVATGVIGAAHAPQAAMQAGVLRADIGTVAPMYTTATTPSASDAGLIVREVARGQATMANSMPVTLASNQSALAVSAASLPLPSGAATSAKQDLLLTELQLKADLTETQPVSAASLPLPSGASTAARQDTGNTSLASIDGKLTNPLPVSGTFWQATQPVSGPLTDVQLRAVAVPVSGTFFQVTQPVSGTFWQATQPISAAALPLPTNAAIETGGNLATIAGKDFATSAKQDIGNTSVANIDTKTPALGQALAAASTPVVLTAAQVTTLTPPAAIAGFSLESTQILQATAAKQDLLLAELQLKADLTETQPISAVALPLPSNAAQETGGNLATLVTQTAPLIYARAAAAAALVGPMMQAVVSESPESFVSDTLQPLSLTSQGRVRVSSVQADVDRVWQHTFDSPWSNDNPWQMESPYV